MELLISRLFNELTIHKFVQNAGDQRNLDEITAKLSGG